MATIASATFCHPTLISYQGRLTDANGLSVPDGSYLLQFALFESRQGGGILWQETNSVVTSNGLFSHQLGSAIPIPTTVLTSHDSLFLRLTVDGESIAPRTLFTSVPYSRIAAAIHGRDSDDSLAIVTDNELHRLTIFSTDSARNDIILNGSAVGDSSVMFPDSAINADEILDEPGITSRFNINLVPLATADMTDLVTLTIEIPADGYILLQGKCYLLLSGTTGPNIAQVQIDDEEGGSALFPYYSVAGLNGYVNTGINYFPLFVTRVFHLDAGKYVFRLEGMAMNPPPASAESWDHILVATYYPTSYFSVKVLKTTPEGDPSAIPIEIQRPIRFGPSGTFYEVDLRYREKSKAIPSKTDSEDNR